MKKLNNFKEYLEIGKKETTDNYKGVTPGEQVDEKSRGDSWTKELIKRLLPKKLVHKIKRALHAEDYKKALKLYHQMVKEYNRNPEAQNRPGMFVANPKGLALAKAAEIMGIKPKELRKVLDRKTRYEEYEIQLIETEIKTLKRERLKLLNNAFKMTLKSAKQLAVLKRIDKLAAQIENLAEEIYVEEVTKADLNDVEKFADKIFAKVGIDIEFTRHFLDRVNDKRNGKEINVAELTRLFKQTYKKHGKKIPKLGDDAQAVLNDIQTDINMPFVLHWDEKAKEFDLIAKTIMRKKNFKTTNQKLRV